MPLYTFYPCQRDGNSTTFETHELVDDGEALVRARIVAADHRSCAYVAVWCGERKVLEHIEDGRTDSALSEASEPLPHPSVLG